MSSYKTEVEICDGIICVRYQGLIDVKAYRALAAQGDELIRAHRMPMFWDLSDAELNVNLSDLHLLQSQIPVQRPRNMVRFKIAAIVSKRDLEKWLFVENINDQIGYMKKVCINREQAFHWLKNSSSEVS